MSEFHLVCCLLLILAGGFSVQTAHAQPEMTITGHEEPLIYDLSQDITCSVTGMEMVSMTWMTNVAGYRVEIVSKSNVSELVLSLAPEKNSTLLLDGSNFICVAVGSDGNRYDLSIDIQVKELEHNVSITPSSSGTVSTGSSLTLTCTAVCDRVPLLTWVGPSGAVTTGNGITVSPQTDSGRISTLTLTFNSIRTSHAGNYKCTSELTEPLSTVQADYLIRVQIPEPTVTISRDPDSSTRLFTKNSLLLTCAVTIDTAVDTQIFVNTQMSGHASLSDSPRVAISRTPYTIQVAFSSLKSRDSGTYECGVQIVSVVDVVMSSSTVVSTIDVSISLFVAINITYNPPSDFTHASPPYYRPASTVNLTCVAYGATGSVTYQWSSTCSSCFVRGTSQSVTDNILVSSDAGNHTCTATDSDSNSGNATTEMRIIGAGIYVTHSQFISSSAVPNNSIAVVKYSSCNYCRMYFYCYSEASTGTVYIRFPNNYRQYSTSGSYNMRVYQTGSAGVQAYNYQYSTPSYTGVYTCEVPDSEGNTLHFSTVWFTSPPGAPEVYSSTFRDSVENTSTDALLEVICHSSVSPPTKVMWMHDGEMVNMTSTDFEQYQVVTNRRSVRYDNMLIVKNASYAAGRHNYTCIITNSQGSTMESITTNITAYSPASEITSSGPRMHGEDFHLTCSVSLRGKLNAELLKTIKLKWEGPFGVVMTEGSNVTIGDQVLSSNTTTLTLSFTPLNTSHAGLYVCIATSSLPSLAPYFRTALRYPMIVISRALFQLKFGPVVRCSRWYEDMNTSTMLERDIKTAIVNAISSHCRCGFQQSSIDLGEFSCQTTTSTVIYRARVTTTSDVINAEEFLTHLHCWVEKHSTFLYTYYGRIRLRLIASCPVHIKSYDDAECGASLGEISEDRVEDVSD